MELQQLRYFQTVARLENMSHAAEALFVSQPNLSYSISRLEDELGKKLFDRRRGKICLNAAGQQFLAVVNDALATLDNGVEALCGGTHSGGTIYIANMVTDSAILKQFLLRYPTLNVRYKTLDLSGITEGLLKREIDLALTVLPPSHSQLTFERVYECDYVVLLSRQHPLARAECISYEDLREEPLIFDNSRTDISMTITEFLRYGIMPNITQDIGYLDVLLTLVEANRGITFLPRVNYQEIALAGHFPDLICKPFAYDVPRAFWGITYNKNVPLKKEGTYFKSFVTEYYEKIAVAYAAQHPEEDAGQTAPQA